MTSRRVTAKLPKTLPRRATGGTERVPQGNVGQKLKGLKGQVTLDVDLDASRERR
jgi:hypothetical protein